MATAMNLRIRVEEEEEFVISRSGAVLSPTIKTMLDGGVADVITLPNIGGRTFPMIISYLETHAAVDLSDEEKWNFDSEFASSEKDIDFLKKLMIDAHHLKIEGLKGVLAPKLADLLKIRSEKSNYKWVRDHIQSRGWKEESVRHLMKMNWAFVDLQQRCRKRLKELDLDLEDLEKQAKKINMQRDLYRFCAQF